MWINDWVSFISIVERRIRIVCWKQGSIGPINGKFLSVVTTRQGSKQLQKLARILKFCMKYFLIKLTYLFGYPTFQKMINKSNGQTLDVQAGLHLYCSFVCLFDLIINVPVNNLSVMSGRVFLGWTSTKQGLMRLAQGHNAVTQVRLEPLALGSQV